MERLTKSQLVNGFLSCYPENDSGLPELIMENNPYRKIIEKLKEYEDLEEQGKMLKLRCAVGDTVWCIQKYSGGGRVPDWGEKYESKFYIGMYEEIGKTVFLTEEEAEAALKEISNSWKRRIK